MPVTGLARIVPRADLQSALLEALPVGTLMLDHEAEVTNDDADRPSLKFADGRTERADLIVDDGGIRSATFGLAK